MFVLDTDIVIWILRGDRKVISSVDKLIDNDRTGISTITIAEVYKYTFPSELHKNEDVINHQELFSVTKEIAVQAGLYWNQYHKKLLRLSLSDTIVAATCRSENCQLLTLNTRHFPMTDIKVLNPLKP